MPRKKPTQPAASADPVALPPPPAVEPPVIEPPSLEKLTWAQIGMTEPAHGPIPQAVINEAIRVRLLPNLAPMIDAQIAAASGVKFLVTRDPGGKFRVIGKDEAARLASDPDATVVEVWEKQPSTFAFKDLLDRAGGKPKETVDMNHGAQSSLADLIGGSWRPKD